MVGHENGCIYDEDDIVREIHGIGIKNYATHRGDHVIELKTPFPDRDVEFPASKKEEIIITYQDKCSCCGEYIGEAYNIIYKYIDSGLGLSKGEYNGRIHVFRALETVEEIDNAGLDVNQQYTYLELSNYNPPFNNIVKVYVQKSGWEQITEAFFKENERQIKVGDPLFNLIIDKQNRVLNYSFPIDKKRY